MPGRPRAYILNLGCARNLVDAELIGGALGKSGFVLTDTAESAELVLLNTCGFIEDAKRESIDALLQALAMKKEGTVRAVIVAGCLTQRYRPQLAAEFPEVDAFVGVNDIPEIARIARAVMAKTYVRVPGACRRPAYVHTHTAPRALMTPPHFAYLKIQEGCANRCTYCAIPSIRGPLRSRSLPDILREAERLPGTVKELNVVGQDITAYGTDRVGRSRLPALITELARLSRFPWIRLLYTHPAHYTDGLIRVIQKTPSVCRYLDLPVQHASDAILSRMNRRTSQEKITRLIARLRAAIPDLVLRSTVLIGFPGERERDFAELIRFLEQIRFERLGAFIYSPEEGTPAARLSGQVPLAVKRKRFDTVMRVQQEISRGVNDRFRGRVLEILIDEPARSRQDVALGRTAYDAPDVDGLVHVHNAARILPGEFVRARITDTLEYDLVGEKL